MEYIVYFDGNEVGRTMAASSRHAINNYRFTHVGIFEMAHERDNGWDSRYTARAAIVEEFEKLYGRH